MDGSVGRREETGHRSDRFYKYFYIFAEPLFHHQGDAKLASPGRVIVVFAQMDYWEKTALKVC